MIIAKNQSPKKTLPLILASASSGRAYVLKQAGIEFQVNPADVDEHNFTAGSIAELVSILALAKANKIKERHRSGIILAVDTLVAIDDKVIGKPKDAPHACEILSQLSGKTHQVISGIVVLDLESNKIAQDVVITSVTFRKLSAQEINDYVATEEPFGKSGAYSSQEKGKEYNRCQALHSCKECRNVVPGTNTRDAHMTVYAKHVALENLMVILVKFFGKL